MDSIRKSQVVDWRKAGRSFRHLLKERGDRFKFLCDARNYKDYKDYEDDEGVTSKHHDGGSISG